MQAPHPPLKSYYPDEQARGPWVRELFDRTAGDYDRVERAMAWGSGPWYRRRALRNAGLAAGMRVLDIGVGTGLVACEAAALVGNPAWVTGVDPSPGMVAHARVPPGLRLLAGSAEKIPVPSATADFLSMGYALRHISDFNIAFAEFMRVLKPGGRVCVLEISMPTGRIGQRLLKLYMNSIVPWIARRVGRHVDSPLLMHYYWETIAACAKPPVIMESLRSAGFVQVRRRLTLGIFSEYCALKPAT